jgi:carboxypeptidase family protein
MFIRVQLLCLQFAAALLLTTRLYSQQDAEARWRDCPYDPRGGVVKGRVLNDSTGKPIPRRGVMLVGFMCVAVTDSNGEFAFQRVRAGEYYLKPGELGYRRFPPVRVDLASDTTLEIDLLLRPENLLADCQEIPHCRDLLAVRDTDSFLSPDEALRATALRTTIALTAAGEDSAPRWVACIEDSSAAVLLALHRNFPNALGIGECIIDVRAHQRTAVTARGTDSPARLFSIDSITINGVDRAWSNTHFYAGPLWAEGWSCAYVREDDEWIPTSCKMTWIS